MLHVYCKYQVMMTSLAFCSQSIKLLILVIHTNRAGRPCTIPGSKEYTFEQGQNKVQARSSETGKKVSKGFGSTNKHTATPVQRRRVLIWTET